MEKAGIKRGATRGLRIGTLFLVLSAWMGAWAGENAAPVFRLNDVEGQAFDLGAHLGQEVILLDFWATFCVPCLAELNTYRDLQLRYKDQGLRIVAVSVDQPQTAARVRSFAHARAFPFPVLLDPEQQAYRLYGVAVMPTSILIDRQGRIVYRKEGFQPGDEGELEKRLVELLKPPTPARPIPVPIPISASSPELPAAPIPSAKPAPTGGPLGNVSLSGSNFLRTNYGKESRSLPNSNGWFEDWFDFRVAGDKLSYQARFREYQFLRDLPDAKENLIRDPTSRVVKQTFEYSGDHTDIRAGNLYGNLNRGLVLRAFEDRQARIDKDLKGAWASLQGGTQAGLGRGRISVFGGNTFSRFTDLHTLDADEDKLRDTYLQGLEGEWEPVGGLKAGAQYVEAFRENWHVKLAAGNGEWLYGPTTVYLAYAGLLGQDQFNYPNEYHGRAVYASLGENLGRLELGGEYKYYYNYDLGFTEPPSLVKYHTFRLMARDMLFSNNQGEQGFQTHGTWRFRDQDFYSLNLSRIVSRPERNPTLLVHHVELPYVDIDQSLQLSGSKGGTALFDVDLNRQRKFAEGSFEDIDAATLGMTLTKPLPGPWNMQWEAELQRRNVKFLTFVPPDPDAGKLGDVGGVYAKNSPWLGVLSATLGRNSAWTFTLDYEATTSSLEKDTNSFHYRLPRVANGWASAYLTVSALEGNQISLWFGQRKERVVCSGGSCRLEPAFEGGELIWITHF